ncbi:hypothetical protein GBAR_LOCUS9038, partial [Geodia barretti]
MATLQQLADMRVCVYTVGLVATVTDTLPGCFYLVHATSHRALFSLFLSRFSASEVQETVEQEEEKGKLADFMKAIHTLGSREDIEPPNEIGEDKESVNMAEQEPTLQSGAPSVGEVPTSFWHQVMDSNSNHPYYWSPVTNEVSWTLPDGGV